MGKKLKNVAFPERELRSLFSDDGGLGVAKAVAWATGKQAVTDKLAEIEDKPQPKNRGKRPPSCVDKWLSKDKLGEEPLLFAQFWRVWVLALMCDIPPWKLVGVEIPKHWLRKPS